jgi:hypothetical protein
VYDILTSGRLDDGKEVEELEQVSLRVAPSITTSGDGVIEALLGVPREDKWKDGQHN